MNLHASKDVLIVDDDDAIRKLVGTALSRAGLTCDTAQDGIYAVEQLRESAYGVVILDLMMPRLDGLGVLREIRSLQWLNDRRPIILIVTASTERNTLDDVCDLVQVVIRKPFDILELSELVRDCVDARRHHSLPESYPRAESIH
jgi:DNA-binding response OmpR family regulator